MKQSAIHNFTSGLFMLAALTVMLFTTISISYVALQSEDPAIKQARSWAETYDVRGPITCVTNDGGRQYRCRGSKDGSPVSVVCNGTECSLDCDLSGVE